MNNLLRGAKKDMDKQLCVNKVEPTGWSFLLFKKLLMPVTKNMKKSYGPICENHSQIKFC